jgi:hypothetical protein
VHERQISARAVRREQVREVNALLSPEIALGVDLIYYQETRASLTLVQHKAMDHDDWYYHPSGDSHITKQLDRMRAIDKKCLQSALDGDDYRLSAAPCWIKLCRSENVIPRTDELIRGMYLTRAYFERLKDYPDTPCRGKQGAVRFSYASVPRYLDNTTFAQLVADGWIGSSGTGTDLIKEQIAASLAGQRQPILAFASGEVPKGRRTRERISGSPQPGVEDLRTYLAQQTAHARLQPHTTARNRKNSQPAYAQARSCFPRWWQVQGSNLRRLSRRFYSPCAP